ncbi:S-adenosyl-L-methionine-dependent methyltransferase [Stachybotrys elegans]|uniref:S-adenosyl-L-methionine-dependent methyltransferase n=1 Tax=Stachybotrys elegans TaxID=80388 RepID=A0A8K0STP9_9HYPO|nr:S-adenosyl-L-methionine-dependent methyltransferase [Stachybotrys elegans]
MESWTKTIYPFDRGSPATELARLSHLHFNIWVPLTGGKLVPSHIADALEKSPEPRVADIATGNGVWLTSIAQQLPHHAELYGFDIDPTKFPTAEPNMSFQQHDLLHPFPEHLQGTFDLVHVRLLYFALKADEWAPAIRQATTLLKPGGWILWEEMGHMSVRLFPPSKALEEFWRAYMLHNQTKGRDMMMPYHLLGTFKRSNLTECDEKMWLSWGAELPAGAAPVLTLSMNSMMAAIIEDGGMETIQTVADMKRLGDIILQEIDKGAQFGFDWRWVWGRRPLTN